MLGRRLKIYKPANLDKVSFFKPLFYGTSDTMVKAYYIGFGRILVVSEWKRH